MSKKRNPRTGTKTRKERPPFRKTKPKRDNKKCMCGHGRRKHKKYGACKLCECRQYYRGVIA